MCSIIGRFTSGSMGLGTFEVSGRRRVPSPPAMITAFTAAFLLVSSHATGARRRSRRGPVLRAQTGGVSPSRPARSDSRPLGM
jgi:hypothetical protein